MKLCPNCHTSNTDDACFCENCGFSLSGVPVTPDLQPGPQSWQQPGPQPWQQPGPQPRPQPRPKPRKPRRKPSKGLIIAAVEAVVLVALVIAFFVVGSSRTDPTKVATDYFQAMAEGDWDTIISLTDVPESPFLTSEAFQTACEEWDLLGGGQLAQVSASREESDSVSNTMGDYVTYVTVEYMLRGEPYVRTLPLSLVKGEGKELFLFSTWQVVDCLPFVARNFQIEIPAGATLAVDGLVVDASFRTRATEYSEIYSLDLFVGTHEIVVETEGVGEQSWNYGVWYDDAYLYAADVSLSASVQNTLISSAKSLLEQIFEAALAQEGCSAIESGFANGGADSQLSYYYEQLEDYLFDSDNWRALRITLSDFSVWDCSVYYGDDGLYAYLDLEFDCIYEYATLRNGYLDSTGSRTNYGDFILTFVYQDGGWVPNVVQTLQS